MSTVASFALTSSRHELDLSPEAFGPLREANDLLDQPAALRTRFREDGYLFLRDYLNRADVLAARREILRRLDAAGDVDPGYDLMDGVSLPDKKISFSGELGNHNPPLAKVLYQGPMIRFYETLFDGPVRHYDYTWFRCISGGNIGTQPHADVVYMGRGTWNLCTSWTPIGDIDLELGGLMVLEGSAHQTQKLQKYWQRDVDTYCTNRADAPAIERGEKQWQWGGALGANPVTLRANLGGRWLTTDYRAGDLLVFSTLTVHASLDNHANRFRLSSDSRYQPANEPVDERWVGPHPIAHGLAGKRGRIC